MSQCDQILQAFFTKNAFFLCGKTPIIRCNGLLGRKECTADIRDSRDTPIHTQHTHPWDFVKTGKETLSIYQNITQILSGR